MRLDVKELFCEVNYNFYGGEKRDKIVIVKNQGGLRISVKEVTLNELESIDQTAESELTFRCRWRVAGWIGHWGHIHRRANEHLALVTVAPLDGKWKISAIEILDERPLESPQAMAVSQQVGSK